MRARIRNRDVGKSPAFTGIDFPDTIFRINNRIRMEVNDAWGLDCLLWVKTFQTSLMENFRYKSSGYLWMNSKFESVCRFISISDSPCVDMWIECICNEWTNSFIKPVTCEFLFWLTVKCSCSSISSGLKGEYFNNTHPTLSNANL